MRFLKLLANRNLVIEIKNKIRRRDKKIEKERISIKEVEVRKERKNGEKNRGTKKRKWNMKVSATEQEV